MNVLETLQVRYSLRDFAEKEIEEEKLEVILEAGRLAPHCQQPAAHKGHRSAGPGPAPRHGRRLQRPGFCGQGPGHPGGVRGQRPPYALRAAPPHGRLLHRPVLHVCPGSVPGGAGVLDRRF